MKLSNSLVNDGKSLYFKFQVSISLHSRVTVQNVIGQKKTKCKDMKRQIVKEALSMYSGIKVLEKAESEIRIEFGASNTKLESK